jgi:hypothetical protein
VERQETEGWGKSVVRRLSADLRQEFPGVSGFSTQNLWYMRQLYSGYHENERLQPLVGEIAWAQNFELEMPFGMTYSHTGGDKNGSFKNCNYNR